MTTYAIAKVVRRSTLFALLGIQVENSAFVDVGVGRAVVEQNFRELGIGIVPILSVRRALSFRQVVIQHTSLASIIGSIIRIFVTVRDGLGGAFIKRLLRSRRSVRPGAAESIDQVVVFIAL